MKKLLLLTIAVIAVTLSYSQIPNGYYDSANGLTGDALKSALHNIIKNHTSVSYSSLDNYYQTTDKKPNGKVWDMYSDVPGGTPPYEYTFAASDQCGNYSAEGDCWNKEHTWPQSLFSENMPMKSDMFHVYPTDGKVNGMRSNYPHGEVNNPTWTSLNGGKLGNCSYPGYSSLVFEPIDAYKGDFARSYFYMATRYYTEDGSWNSWGMANKVQLLPWAVAMLEEWCVQDPVSQKEIDRNNAVYTIQHNRNPFIDHPEYIFSIWGNHARVSKLTEPKNENAFVFPNPSEGNFTINYISSTYGNYDLKIYDNKGIVVYYLNYNKISGENNINLDLSSLSKGIYFIKIISNQSVINKPIVIN